VTDSLFWRAEVGGSWLAVGQEQIISSKMQVVSCKGRTRDQEEGKSKPSDQSHSFRHLKCSCSGSGIMKGRG